MKFAGRISRRRLCLFLFVGALLLRLFYLWEVRENPFFRGLGLDSRYYDRRAQEIQAEGLIGDDAYFMGPLYPHLLALVYTVAGRNLTLVRVLQAVLSALVPVLTYRIGARLFCSTTALVAAVLACLYAPFIFYVGSILYTTLAITLLLWILDRITAPSGGRPSLHRFLTGLLYGLASVGKGNILLFLPFAVLALARNAGRKAPGNWRAPLPFLAGIMLVIALVTARNYASSGDLVLLTSNSGLNFYIGNGPVSSGAYEKPKGLDVENDPTGRVLLEKELGRALSPSEVSRIWMNRAIRFVLEEPIAELRLLVRKAVFFLSTFEVPQIESFRFQQRYSRLATLLHIPFGLIAPLGLAAAVMVCYGRTFVLVSFFFAYAASVILFFVLTRYRLPVLPVLFLFASRMIVESVREGRRGEWGGFLRRLARFAPLFLLCNINFYGISQATGDAQSHYRLGIIYRSEGRPEDAIREYNRSIELDPRYARSRLNLGEILALRGEVEAAEEQFREAVRIDPQYPKARLNHGVLLYRSGRREAGRGELVQAVALDPDYGKAWLHLAALAFLEGEPGAGEKAEKALFHLKERDPSRTIALELRARVDETERINEWRDGHGLAGPLPAETREGVIGELFGDRGDVEDLFRAGAGGNDPGALYAWGAFLFRREDLAGAGEVLDRAAGRAPDLPFLHFALGVLWLRKDNAELARGEFLLETTANPSFTPAWKNAALLAARAGSMEEATRLAGEYVRWGGEPDDAIRPLLTQRSR